ncbi:Protein TBRG4 [Habropoda laboriosa]|uniref:Protein TBRG4 n=1 Tax=Habropoda laboriosa TaxID=597456 RepID=A0A0L7QLM6_9HYME|nr:Protein TBRG4 [Habropoda laboriosa]
MLQFNTTFCTVTTRFTFRLLWRLNVSFNTNSATLTSESVNKLKPDHQIISSNAKAIDDQHVAFNQLKTKLCHKFSMKSVDLTQIKNANTVHDLIEIMKTPKLSQHDIANAMATIVTWINVNNTKSSRNKISVTSPENVQEIKFSESKDNINEVKLAKYCDFSTAEMIKEINKLSTARNRNIYLVKFFFENITKYNTLLSVGQCSSLLFNMSILNYSDEELLKKICNDLTQRGDINSETLMSILKSMACVRYKNEMFLKHVCDIVTDSKSFQSWRIINIINILYSMAILGYCSEDVDKVIEMYKSKFSHRTIENTDWLNLIWSLTIFKKASISDIASVLDESFVSKIVLKDSIIKSSYRLKLLNINGYAQYAVKNYEGSLLSQKIVPYITNNRSKQKILYIDLLQDTLKNMVPSLSHFKMNVDTKMGFLLGILMLDYYDMCLGDTDYQGLIKLHEYLLTCKNYRVLCISYQYFGLEDKVEKRITYLRRQLWKKFNNSF